MGGGREEAYNGPLGKLSRLSGRGLLPPEGSPMVWKEPRPGKHARGLLLAGGQASSDLLNLSEFHFLICKMSLQRSLGFLKTL